VKGHRCASQLSERGSPAAIRSPGLAHGESSQRYVEKLTSAFRDQLRLVCAVTSIQRTPRGVVINDSHGRRDAYDHVVLASRSDQAPAMLSDADDRDAPCSTPLAMPYLHRDIRLVFGPPASVLVNRPVLRACFHFIRRNHRICLEIQSMIASREHRRFGAPVIRERIFEQDYAKTLAIQRSNFRVAWPHLIHQASTIGSGGCGISPRRNSLRRTNGAQNASTLSRRALGSVSIYNRPAKIPCT